MFMIFFYLTGILLITNILTDRKERVYLRLFDLGIVLIGLLVILFGLALLVLPEAELSRLLSSDFSSVVNYQAAGWTAVVIGGWEALVGLIPLRRLLARWLPLDPASPMHTLALVFSGYLAGNTILTLTQGGLADLAETAVPATTVELMAQFLLFIMIAVLGVGWLIRRDHRGTLARLGLERPSREQLAVGLRWMVGLVVLQWVIAATWALFNPEQLDLVDNISGTFLTDIDTVGEWLFLAVGTGLSEELLFRGAMQPVLGLKVTAVLFAVAHVQYGITPVTLAVLLIGMALGYIRRQYNTTTAVFVHAGYNFILGLLTLLATWLGPMVNGG